MWKNTFFHDCGIWGVGEARLPVCGVLVLTHNFKVWRPVVARLLVFWDWGLWFHRGQWQNCKSKQVGGSFDSKPILLWLQQDVDATGNFVRCLQLSKLKLGLELKQKFAPKPTFLNNSKPPLLMWKNTFFHDCGIWGVGEIWLPVCGVLVLTHNFEVWRPVIVWLLVFVIIGLWLQIGQWQNCKSKQVVGFDSKPILFVVETRCRRNRKFCSLSLTFKAEARFRVKTKI